MLERLCALGLDETGGISIQTRRRLRLAGGAPGDARAREGFASDAVLWEQVEQTVSESTELSFSFLALHGRSRRCLAAVGILTDSAILIVGAMVVGPEFGPLAALCVAIVRRRPRSRGARATRARRRASRSRSSPPMLLTAVLRAVRPRARRRRPRGSRPDLLHLASGHVLGARRAARGHGGDALALDGEVGSADRRPHLGDDDPRGGEHRRCGRLPELGRVPGRGAPARASTSARSSSPGS